MSQHYRIVSEVRTDGEQVDIPDEASNVSVEPLATAGHVRVTYLKPTQRIAVDGGDETEPRRYID
ncbi:MULTISPECIES: hypothetical protein [Halomicrobium]|uniref:Uncharacterized protein n=2 Tax=Halomicrobium mukohataei TaxID=57705 RepID=C7P1J8_HALMD|nr:MULTISPECIES: hypothetical protein [Halomicrobium]ACV47206.1 hypothetical protein Hmuk_1079 [Halomicrobium mukohataei DSM 12286]